MKKITFLKLLLVIPITLSANEDRDLQAYYTFDDESGLDYSDNGFDLTLFGEVGFDTGLFGSSLAPNGDNNRYASRTQDDPQLDFEQSDFTVQAWVRYNNVIGEQILLEKFSGTSGPGWTLTKLFDQRFAFATNDGATPIVRSPVQEIALGTWHNVTIRKTDGLYELFFNNELVVSLQSNQGSESSDPLLVGRRNGQDGRDFSLEGAIDEIAIWSRALSNTELDVLYNNGRGRSVRTVFSDGFELSDITTE